MTAGMVSWNAHLKHEVMVGKKKKNGISYAAHSLRLLFTAGIVPQSSLPPFFSQPVKNPPVPTRAVTLSASLSH
jgi:hypothetical protein